MVPPSVSPPPPKAQVIPRVYSVHSATYTDPYFWLRERDNPEVIAYLEAENAYAEAFVHPEPQQHLYQELVGRIQETDLSVPVRLDHYAYYARTETDRQYAILCRQADGASEEVLLDLNQLAEGHPYFSLGTNAVSPDHRLLAYAIDTSGAETYTLYVKDLMTGDLRADVIPNTSASACWANDNHTLFYTVLDEAKRPYKLFRHTLGTDPQADVLVYHETDDAYFLGIGRTRSKGYLVLHLQSKVTSEVHYLDANDPYASFRVVHPRQKGLEYSLDHLEDHFYILTNDQAQNFKLVKAPVTDPAKANWQDVIPHREQVKLDQIEVLRGHIIVLERQNALERIYVLDLEGMDSHYIEFPEPVYTVHLGDNPEIDTDLLRFTYASLVTPNTVFDYNLVTRERELKKQYAVLGGYDPSYYQSERLFATAPDGARIPISLVYRKDMVRDANHPLYLYGYGSYGYSLDPSFSSARLSLLDRGFIFALAHVRGGEELGRPWYEDGKLLQKKNTFTDFIAVAEYLVAEHYTSPSRLVISGGSAGGLLVGAVANLRPELFAVVVAQVPFVDVVNTMLDSSLPLTVVEYDEWGNPNDREFFDYIRSYSPYDNVTAQDYPHLLITAGLNDPRVSYWEPAKWCAKLRALKTDAHILLLKTNMGAGHGGASGRYDRLKEVAFEYAFILRVLGIAE
ncbi:S9 family peptidase [Anthocerotibacter panamensis]|uniref:S9 family peptidase n=1 Tax=Anthocerotibacter panamensis TaxID=2857077 RepID=UPI001C404D48|nr:S9 family peptidase [Anthocerotibacter panamensis]